MQNRDLRDKNRRNNKKNKGETAAQFEFIFFLHNIE